jgi:hypothetical protein
LAALGLAALLTVGLYLWAADDKKSWGDLGEGVCVSVIVAIALMALQRDADETTRQADQRREHATERRNLLLTLALQPSLRGVSLAGLDLRGVFLPGRNLRGVNLRGANL